MTSGRSILPLFLILFLFSACSSNETSHSGSHDHSDHHQRLTHWVDDLEIFALFEVHENSGRIEGELFFSKNHQPLEVLDGEVRFVENGSVSIQQDLNSSRKGIYPFELTFRDSDEPDLSVAFRTESNRYDIVLGSVSRYERLDSDIDEAEVVVLDKAMQWRMNVASGIASYHTIPEIVQGIGTVIYNPEHYHEVYSPVDGYIDSGSFNIVPVAGTSVTPGKRLLTISPPLSSQNSWTALRLAYRQASQAFERAQRLLENDAISLREYQEREREFEVRKAGYEQFLNENRNGSILEDGGNQLYINSAHHGVIAESNAVSGREIKQGDHLFSIFDPSHLWV
ncbi:MAG: HlyD family secretion protein, partial [Balneolaceae bacterium]